MLSVRFAAIELIHQAFRNPFKCLATCLNFKALVREVQFHSYGFHELLVLFRVLREDHYKGLIFGTCRWHF